MTPSGWIVDNVKINFTNSSGGDSPATKLTPLPSGIYDPLDAISGNLRAIDEPHDQVHDGITFRYSDSVTLASGNSQDYLITTPALPKTVHLVWDADGTAVTSFFLYEGSDKTGTTPQTVFNANRNSATAAAVTIAKGTSGGTTDGTLLMQYASGVAAGNVRVASALSPTHDDELILKASTKYIFRITSGTNGNLTNLKLNWYEEPGTGS